MASTCRVLRPHETVMKLITDEDDTFDDGSGIGSLMWLCLIIVMMLEACLCHGGVNRQAAGVDGPAAFGSADAIFCEIG